MVTCLSTFSENFNTKKARRNSGGIVLYIKEELVNGIEIVKNHYDTIIWLKLDHIFFNISEDFYICATYIWGHESPVYNTFNVDLFEILENDITYFSEFGKVFVAGDLNSRVGNKFDYIVHDKINTVYDDDDYCPDNTPVRASVDISINSHGLKLLDLCKSTCLRIANGRVGNSCKQTFYSNNGTSVIDYLLANEYSFSSISDFTVHDFNEFSDHAPLHFSLLCNNVSAEYKSHTDVKYKWDDALRGQFRSGIISMLPVFNTIVQHVDYSSRTAINDVLNRFTETIRSVADPLFSKTYVYNTHPSFKVNSCIKNADWFDNECQTARNVYHDALRIFNSSKTDINREHLCTCKRIYKDLIRKKKACCYRKKMIEIENLRKHKPRDFWRFFKSKNRVIKNKISLEEFTKFFENLSSNISDVCNIEAEDFCLNNDFNLENSSFPELDLPISVEEVRNAIKHLKRNKSSGSDCMLNEYFLECSDILSAHLCDVFNGIFVSGFFPDKWTEGVIIPLHKKGSVNDVNNYRGITLVSCFSKLFTTILNKRIETFCNENTIISDAQFGFRKGYSTVDAIFILMSIVQNYLNENKRLYVIYVDMLKCFDSIYRNALWLKMFKSGIQGKLLRIVKDMYANVKSRVKSCSSYSDYFSYAVGLRQGEVMSPILFSLFVEDLELYLQDNINSGLSIDDIVLIVLLFADDMAILGKSPAEVQSHLDKLYLYCNAWGLNVNTAKTKIMVFRKRGGLKENEKWTYNGNVIEVVDNFNYLGTVLNYTGSFKLNQEHLVGKALKALNTLLIKCHDFDIKPKIFCQLFDSFVGSILNYASEVWGFSKSDDIERIHLKFCKRLLQVKINTCNVAVYGELGRYPLYVNRYIKIIKFWFKILNNENIIMQIVYKQALHDCNKGYNNWVTNVKNMLNNYGFGYVFENPNVVQVNSFVSEFKCRLVDNFKQEWYGKMNNSSVLDMYKIYKSSLEYEEYLDLLPKRLRLFFVRLRVSAHPLRIQTGRYAQNNIPRNERYCLCCNSVDLEDEYHFICICRCYIDLRNKYISRIFYINPSVYKFHKLLVSSDRLVISNVCKYIKEALVVRNTILNNTV